MSVADVSNFITRLIIHFKQPTFDVPDERQDKARNQWLADMNRSLKDAAPEVLDRAADILIDTAKYKSFPILGEVRKAVEKAANELRQEQPRMRFSPTKKLEDDYSEREKLALELILGEVGRRALREDWLGSLYAFCVKHMRLPTNFEINDSEKGVIAEARAFDRELDRCRGAPPGSVHAQLLPIGITMLERRKRLATYVETGVLPNG